MQAKAPLRGNRCNLRNNPGLQSVYTLLGRERRGNSRTQGGSTIFPPPLPKGILLALREGLGVIAFASSPCPVSSAPLGLAPAQLLPSPTARNLGLPLSANDLRAPRRRMVSGAYFGIFCNTWSSSFPVIWRSRCSSIQWVEGK